MSASAPNDWEDKYTESLRAEEESRRPTPFTDAYVALGMVLPPVAIVVVALGWLGSKVGVPFRVGEIVALAVVGVVALVLVVRWLRRRSSR